VTAVAPVAGVEVATTSAGLGALAAAPKTLSGTVAALATNGCANPPKTQVAAMHSRRTRSARRPSRRVPINDPIPRIAASPSREAQPLTMCNA
jgi:hypothetical protein